ncbi:hypothetical protein U9M48_001494 [Paspalum notatum var. saurae]|uniref:Uncharacterized protein n=1 Tax=Paspalum notatum var. saurae TaxID=547442 RepID=A0AAQ3PFZ5_PASNO
MASGACFADGLRHGAYISGGSGVRGDVRLDGCAEDAHVLGTAVAACSSVGRGWTPGAPVDSEPVGDAVTWPGPVVGVLERWSSPSLRAVALGVGSLAERRTKGRMGVGVLGAGPPASGQPVAADEGSLRWAIGQTVEADEGAAASASAALAAGQPVASVGNLAGVQELGAGTSGIRDFGCSAGNFPSTISFL